MPMYNLMEYSDNYFRKSGILRRYCREEAELNRACNYYHDKSLLILL